MRLFDKKFGSEFANVPSEPGVYSFFDETEKLVYVGKAKNLRRRLGQYRRARGGKMRKILKAATTLRWESCGSELDACLLEVRRIQSDKPQLNIASAFSHRYPLIGLRVVERQTHAPLPASQDLFLCFTTTPEVFADYCFHGAFRSRYITAQAFFHLVRLLQFIGHPIPRAAAERKRYCYEFGLRRLPAGWGQGLEALLRGQSAGFLETLLERLLENAGARAKAKEIQEGIDALQQFWEQECEPLARAMALVGLTTYPVSQTERDPLFIRAGFEKETPCSS